MGLKPEILWEGGSSEQRALMDSMDSWDSIEPLSELCPSFTTYCDIEE